VTADNTIAAEARRLYCENPDDYGDYRRSRPDSSESHAWSEVHRFVLSNRIQSLPVVDLGCGPGPPHASLWRSKSYLGIDFSSRLLADHVFRDFSETRLMEMDLNSSLDALCAAFPEEDRLVLAVLVLHYLEDPAPLISRLAVPGSWFCFIVANFKFDEDSTLEDGTVRRDQGILAFHYYSRALSEYVGWLGPLQNLSVTQCGNEHDRANQQPYYLIGGQW
jgi:SAM-dependent methyltransferase